MKLQKSAKKLEAGQILAPRILEFLLKTFFQPRNNISPQTLCYRAHRVFWVSDFDRALISKLNSEITDPLTYVTSRMIATEEIIQVTFLSLQRYFSSGLLYQKIEVPFLCQYHKNFLHNHVSSPRFRFGEHTEPTRACDPKDLPRRSAFPRRNAFTR